jgi:hypothetical protein
MYMRCALRSPCLHGILCMYAFADVDERARARVCVYVYVYARIRTPMCTPVYVCARDRSIVCVDRCGAAGRWPANREHGEQPELH